MSRSYPEAAHLAAMWVHQATNIPWIANWNDPAPFNWPEPYENIKNPVLLYFHKRLAGMVFREASRVTFPSEELRDHFGMNPAIKGTRTTQVIPHIGLSAKIAPAKAAASDHDIFKICHAGNLSAERSPGPFFNALKRLGERIGPDGFRLDIIGVCTTEVREMAAEPGISAIRFLGNKNYYSAMELLTGYDLLVVVEAPLRTGIFFPSKFVDYLQSGKPVLGVSPATGFMERVLNREHGCGIAADCTDPDAIFTGLTELYDEWRSGRTRFLSKVPESYRSYSPGHVVAQYKEIFNDICS